MKKLYTLLCFVLSTLCLSAGVRTPEAAAQLAADFTNAQWAARAPQRAVQSSASMSLAHTFAKPASKEAALYVFNREEDNGFVLVSADDRTMDVLCYSDEGSFDLETANPSFLWWINRYTEEIANVDSTNAYIGGSMVRRAAQTTAISPLLGNIAWDQEAPYWNQCPMDLWKTSERCLTGCVATATAQVMKYWQYPTTGTGSHSYTWKCCTNSSCTTTKSKTLSCDFSGITFDWNNMLDTYGTSTSSYTTAQANAVATLMYACGVACEMEYGGNTIGGSGAWTDVMGQGLMDYFGYSTDLKFITASSKSEYGTAVMSNAQYNVSTSTFTSLFNTELEAGRPIIMGGEDGSAGGHEFVCDGRDTQGRFHINWGWSGDSNCYCALSSLRPTGTSYSFSSNIDALIGIKPATTSSDTVPVTPVDPDPVTPVDSSSFVTYSLVTDAATLAANQQVLIVAGDAGYALSTTQKTTNRGAAAVTITNNTISLAPNQTDVQEFTLTAGKGANQWGFNTGSGYIYAASSSANQLKTSSALTTDGSFTVAIANDGKATITAQGSATRNVIRFNPNNGSPIFSCYGSSSTTGSLPQLFRRESGITTGLNAVEQAPKATKIILDGHLYIRYGERLYTPTGILIR